MIIFLSVIKYKWLISCHATFLSESGIVNAFILYFLRKRKKNWNPSQCTRLLFIAMSSVCIRSLIWVLFFYVVKLCQYHDFSSSFTVEKIEFSTVNTVEKIQSTLHTFWHNCWRHRYGFGGGLLRERREKKITLV